MFKSICSFFSKRQARRHETILRALEGQELSGDQIHKKTGIWAGRLYPDLLDLEEKGVISSRWKEPLYPLLPGKPRRRLYKIVDTPTRH